MILKKFRYYIYRLRWHIFGLVHLDLELNSVCNHKCVMCWHSTTPKFKLKMIDLRVAQNHLIDGYKAGLRSVKLNLRGEPTLYKNLEQIVRFARNLGYVDIMINSHGTDLQHRFLALKHAGITTIIVSVGSMDPVAYSELHQVSVDEYYKLHDSLMFMHENKGDVRIKLNCHYSKISHFSFDELKLRYPKFKIVKRYIEEREGTNISINRKKVRKPRCPHMHRRLTVHSTGGVYPCCMSFNEQKDIRLGETIPEALISRKKLIREYSKKKYRKSCRNCPSGDVYKFT